MVKINHETAALDIGRFLEKFRLDPIKRVRIANTIDSCIKLVEEGMLIVTEDGRLEYPLLEPIVDDAGNVKLDKLVFKNRRIRIDEIEKLNAGKDIDKIKALLSLMCSIEPAFAGKITADDLTYVNDIASFFMPAQ
jgi:hypothetical protein